MIKQTNPRFPRRPTEYISRTVTLHLQRFIPPYQSHPRRLQRNDFPIRRHMILWRRFFFHLLHSQKSHRESGNLVSMKAISSRYKTRPKATPAIKQAAGISTCYHLPTVMLTSSVLSCYPLKFRISNLRPIP